MKKALPRSNIKTVNFVILQVESEEDDDRKDEKKEKEKQERIEASIRKREEEVQRSLSSSLRERDKEREQHKKDEAIQVFNALLVDLVILIGMFNQR